MLKSSSFFLMLFFLASFHMAQTSTDRVPEWAKKAVWYQIFPERFENGDKTNDPKAKDIDSAWPYFTPKDWNIKRWTSDWYNQDEWELNSGLDFYGNCGLRRYGGDLQGVINKLDYLDSLGITAIYFNPIFESPSLHKYDATMYHHIDKNFGPAPQKDRQIFATENPNEPSTWQWTSADSLFLFLVKEAHKRNMKIIIDGVFNHVGNNFWAFKDVVKNQQNSNYKNWFIVNSWDDPSTENSEFDYEGWYGIKDLPEIKEDENGLIEPAANHIHDIVKRWMDPNGDGDPSDGIDGWRLDVAEMVNINFWKKFRTWVKEINHEAYITGEIWWEDWVNNKMMNASPWLNGDTFDAVMNYRFTKTVKHFIIDKENNSGVQGFIDNLNEIANDYNNENLHVLMNLMGSHDTERLASMIVNPDVSYDHLGHPGSNKNFDVRGPNKLEILKQKLIVGVQMTMPGAPMIYYGDEAGMWGADDPDCRKPMVWPELRYDDEVSHPLGQQRPKDKVEFNHELFDWYQKLIAIRETNEQLSIGKLEFIYKDDKKDIVCYRRFDKNNNVFVLLNNDLEQTELIIPAKTFQNQQSLTDLISGKLIEIDGDSFYIKLKPYQIVILK